MNTYKISAIMPSLNEAKNIENAVNNVIDSFRAFGVNGEIVIVNDGSSDDTGKIADGLSQKYPFIKVIHHERPQGIGASFLDGVWKSGGETVTMIPGDGENDALETIRYLPLMDHVDILVPFVYNKNVRTKQRRFLSVVYRGIINLAFGLTLNYMNGTVIYRKAILRGQVFRSKGFFYQTELLIKTIRSGYLFAEVPYALRQRAGGVSKATTLRSLVKVASNFISILMDVYVRDKGNKEISPDSVTALRWNEIK
ncbi:MAG: glycosyltransferase family 2 protein [Nitrospirae bacterium]|nr:glycosyltransferase family 2 protein [Nitrospirota bacterium]